MSRVHQAIRRAEKENRRELPTESSSGRGLLQSIRQEIPAVVIESSKSDGLPQAAGKSPVHSEPTKIALPVLHEDRKSTRLNSSHRL